MNTKQKQLIAIFAFLFLFTSVVINWNDVGWLFNYRVVNSLVSDFFSPYEDSSLLVSADSIVLPPRQAKAEENGKVYPYSEKSNSLEIPGISITAPLVIGESTDLKK